MVVGEAYNSEFEVVSDSLLDEVIQDARSELLNIQHEDGHWAFLLEADATIPSEYILLNHFLNEIDDELERRLANYIRSCQEEHGGWPLFSNGALDMSCSVKAYFALKLAGDDIDEPHMKRAREAILKNGGAARSNVFTRTSLALFNQLPWRAVPSMPIEIMYFPNWFPFHLNKIAYWSRTTLVPLLILMTLRPKAKNPHRIDISELFDTPAWEETDYYSKKTGKTKIFLWVDQLLKIYDFVRPNLIKRRGINKALSWCLERLNGEDGLGAIFPPMANLLMALDCLGYSTEHPTRKIVRQSIKRLLTVPDNDSQYCQPCVSPIWDTCLTAHALLEAGEDPDGDKLSIANAWMVERQITDVKGDWRHRRPQAEPGGWAFQYNNDHYPDVDDTAVVAMALHRANPKKYKNSIKRAAAWIVEMQSSNGGWGSFDADNDKYYLNHIPFADHGALLDPPTVDVSARCIGFLAQLGNLKDQEIIENGVKYILSEQEANGSWFGRWGTNYIYGTWSALSGLAAAGADANSTPIRKAVMWLESIQRSDGGWGETGDSYYPQRGKSSLDRMSTASQTAWAILALIAAGETNSKALARGINFLLKSERSGSKWKEDAYTAVGFPRVFYLRYHGYSAYFPLWALSRYRSLKQKNMSDSEHFGI